MREMFDRCFADYRPTIHLQQFKYKTFFLKVPEITFCNNTSNLNLTSRHLKKEKKSAHMLYFKRLAWTLLRLTTNHGEVNQGRWLRRRIT